ncbi:hypothetical protein KCP70_13670 [Salmonella enterica subsp. enterica]|nr:hypothetical protein KCP70_13670 [Salmonella enterica subsp. enterica]
MPDGNAKRFSRPATTAHTQTGRGKYKTLPKDFVLQEGGKRAHPQQHSSLCGWAAHRGNAANAPVARKTLRTYGELCDE